VDAQRYANCAYAEGNAVRLGMRSIEGRKVGGHGE
jgi:hypothetical protein